MARVGRFRRGLADDRGAELIEFALVLPILLLVVAGIIEFGFLFQRLEVITNAAREGARMASLPAYTTNAGAVTGRVDDYLNAGVTAGFADSCAVDMVGPVAGAVVPVVHVTVTCQVPTVILSGVAALVNGTFPHFITLKSESVMRVEYVGGP